MKKLLLVSVAGVALVAAGAVNSADAADIYRKAPPPAPAPAYVPPPFSWTGCFVGAQVGWGWGRKNVTSRELSTGGDIGTVFGSGHIDTSGAVFGGQVGCDYQFGWGKAPGTPGNWVIGIQGTFLATDINGRDPDPTSFTDASLSVKTDFIGSVTGRLGFTGFGKSPFLSQTLWYVRGGWAWEHERWDLHDADFAFAFEPTQVKQTRSGWTVGAGVEWAFAPNWSAFVEWNHYDFGNKTIQGHWCDSCSDGPGFDIKQRIETVTIGVNYRFNFFGKAPVVARY